MPQNDINKGDARKTYKHVITSKIAAKAVLNVTQPCLRQPSRNQAKQHAKITLNTNKNGYAENTDVSTYEAMDHFLPTDSKTCLSMRFEHLC